MEQTSTNEPTGVMEYIRKLETKVLTYESQMENMVRLELRRRFFIYGIRSFVLGMLSGGLLLWGTIQIWIEIAKTRLR